MALVTSPLTPAEGTRPSMNRALDHSALQPAAAAAPATGETLPGALIAAARRFGPHPAMRQKRGGIWQSWNFTEYLARAAAMARLLDGAGFAGPGVLATVGENRPELYAAQLAAQGLGATALPLGTEFLRRFGAPEPRPALVLCETEEAARLWRAVDHSGAPVLRLDELGPTPAEAHEEGIAWFAWRVAAVPPDQVALLLHGDGADGAPRAVPLTHARLLAAGRATVATLGLTASDRAMAFLPVSGIADAATALVAPLLAGCCVHCVEGPASFPADLKEVAPTCLPAPARVFELIDRDAQRRLAAGGPLVRALAAAAAQRWPGSGLAFSAPLLNALGLSGCRIALVTSGEIEPQAAARLAAWGLPLDRDTAMAEDGRLLSRDETLWDAHGALRRVEALLRAEPGVDRARVTRAGAGLEARIALAANAAGSEADDREAARATAARAIAAVNTRLAGEGADPGSTLTGFELAPEGFAPAELTLEGEVRHAPPVAIALAPEAARATRAGRPRGPVLMEVRDVHVAFGGVKALTEMSLAIHEGEILSIIGPNGAGKTSLLNVINGVYHPRAGTITFEGKARARMRPAFAARSGIGRTFQHVSLFKGMNVIDNVLVGRAARFRTSLIGKLLRLPATASEEKHEREAAERILAFLELEHLRKAPVAGLPYGIQKRVELGRALATEPRLLLLDEPMAGMTHEEKRDMCGFIRRVNESFGTTILIIEHDIGVVMGLSDRVVVLNYGRKIADGTPQEVRAAPDVIAAYLGSAALGKAA